MQLTARHWTLALATAVLVHGGAAVALLRQTPESANGTAREHAMVVSLAPAPDGRGSVTTAAAETAVTLRPEFLSGDARPVEATAHERPAEAAAVREAAWSGDMPPVEAAARERPAEAASPRPPSAAERHAAKPTGEAISTTVRTLVRPRHATATRIVSRVDVLAPEQTDPVASREGRRRSASFVAVKPAIQRARTGAAAELTGPFPTRSSPVQAARPTAAVVQSAPATPAPPAVLPGSPAKAVTQDPVVAPAHAETPRAIPAAPKPGLRHGPTARVSPARGEAPRTHPTAHPGGVARPVGGPAGAEEDYLTQVRAWLERYKRYPRRARLLRQEGTALLYLVMDRNGKLHDYEVRQSTGHELLDHAVRTMIQRAQPLPRMPDSIHRSRLEVVVPVRFFLR